MYKVKLFAVVTVLALISTPLVWGQLHRGVNGGLDCAVCTVLVGLVSQIAQINNDTVVEASVALCAMLPKIVAPTCKDVVRTLEPVLLDQRLADLLTPDVFCYGIGLCYKTPGERYCHLFPKPKLGIELSAKEVRHSMKRNLGVSRLTWNLCKLPGVREICDALNRSINRVQPALDVDNDWFSTVQSARGTFWRGRDCNDVDPLIYPGRVPLHGDMHSDSNCNGIYGVDKNSNRSYEEMLCLGTDSRGLIFMGDSVGAHFHYPDVWMDPLKVSMDVLHNISSWIFNEGDWPHLGFATGFKNTSQPLLIQGTTDSIYLRMRKRNRCNHRDYQNLSRNGAASNTVLAYMQSIARNSSIDKPALMIYGLFGNDVCNNYKDTISNMTTPEEFRSNVLNVLQFLDTVLPAGSHVLVIGLVDAGFIYSTMSERVHPLGTAHENIRYKDVYEWFTCMQIGPCNGWMTANKTLQKITSKASATLSKVLQNLASTKKFHNFQLHYLENPLPQALWEWQQKGGEVWQMIDPIDSLHPSQLAQPLIADILWRNILKNFPHILGDENPHNSKIEELFGEQGGH